MAKILASALTLASLPSAFAFRDTSPFFLFSTAELSINGNDATIAKASDLQDQVTEALVKCPSKTYIVVRQDGVSSADYQDDLSMQRIGHYMGRGQADVKSTMTASEVVGAVDANEISKYLQTKCGADVLHHSLSDPAVSSRSTYPAEQLIVYATLPSPPMQQRAAILDRHDRFLEDLIVKMDIQDYTVIYTTTAPTEAALQTQHTYEMEDPFPGAVHMELKRDTTAHSNQKNKIKEPGLFEKYQFFSPGLFMGITAVVPLALILYVGIKALSGLEVSYYAFSKEMGPAAQRKQ